MTKSRQAPADRRRTPEILPDSLYHPLTGAKPRHLRPVTVPGYLRPWSAYWPGYAKQVPSWVLQTTIDAHARQQAHSPFEQPPAGLVDIHGHPLTYDNAGFPLNPAGRTGRNANLGYRWRWGARFAGDAWVLTLTTQGWMALLVRRKNGLLASAGGFKDETDPDLTFTGIRELGEETGFIVHGDPWHIINFGHFPDHEQTDHAWVENQVAVWIAPRDQIHSQSLVPQRTEILDCGWFGLDTLLPQHMSPGHDTMLLRIQALMQ